MREGWKTAKLSELCDIQLGKTPARANSSYWDQERSTGNVWLSIADLLKSEANNVSDSKEYLSDKGAKLCKIVKKGTLLVSFKLTLGRVAFAGKDLYTNEAIAALTIHDEQIINRDYLFYFLHFFDWVKAAQDDVKLKGMTLNKAKLKEILVVVPPLPEQKRIVAILDEAFAGTATAVANTEKNLANARELFESYLNAVFSQRGDGWSEGRLENVVHKTCTLSYGIVQPGSDVKGGLPVVRPIDLTEKVIRIDALKTIDPSLAKAYSRTTLHGGDLLLCVRGTTGVVSIAAAELEGANVTRGIVPIRFDESFVEQELGYYLLRSPYVQEQIAEKTYGAALMQINIRDVRKIRIPVPPRDTHDELRAILDDLSAEADRLKLVYLQKLNALSELKQSLLQKAFSGELTAGKEASDAIRKAEEVA